LRATVGRLYRAIALSSPRAVDGSLVSAFTHHHRTREAVAGYLAVAHRLLPELRSPYALARIDCPVLVVWGERDRLLFHEGAQAIIDAVPGARLALLTGVGHCPQVEAPGRLTELVLEFSQAVAA
jgi:pimeloyl-ACP methyl ester carboxylesterase